MSSEKERSKPTRRSPFKGIWFGLGFVFTLVAVFWMLNAHESQSLLSTYSAEAIRAEATVTDKERTDRAGERGRTIHEYSVDVRFWATGTEQELFVLATIDRLVKPRLYKGITVGETVEVLYLPEDPKNMVLLKASLTPDNLGWFDAYWGGVLLALLGMLCFGVGVLCRARAAQGSMQRSK